MKKLFGWISNEPLIWFHYIPLIALQTAYVLLTMNRLTNLPFLAGLYVVTALGDMLIHFALKVD